MHRKGVKQCSGKFGEDRLGYLAIFIPSLMILCILVLHCLNCKFTWVELACEEYCLTTAQRALLFASLLLALPIAMYLTCQKCSRGSLERMRHSIAILTMIGLVIASASASSWEWLNDGADSNSQSVLHIALGTAAVLTLIFVIWRERIASGKASFDRFSRGVQMLGEGNMATRIAGVWVIVDVCQYPSYRRQGLRILSAFIRHPTRDDVIFRVSRNRQDVKSAQEAIRYLRRKYHVSTLKLREK